MRIFMPSKSRTHFMSEILSRVMLGFDEGGLPPPPNLPPMSPFPPPEPTPRRPGGMRDFLIGIGIGLIPLLVAMIGLGGSFNTGGGTSNVFVVLLYVGGGLYLVQIIMAIIFTVVERLRLVGLGMLTMVPINPVVFFISCVALLSRAFNNY